MLTQHTGAGSWQQRLEVVVQVVIDGGPPSITTCTCAQVLLGANPGTRAKNLHDNTPLLGSSKTCFLGHLFCMPSSCVPFPQINPLEGRIVKYLE